MEERVGDNPVRQTSLSHRASSSHSTSCSASSEEPLGRGVPDLPLSNPLGETLGSDFPLGPSVLKPQDEESLTLGYGID